MNKGYTIPVIDISGDTRGQHVVDREPGVYLGHPTTCTLGDGSILCVYPKGHGNGLIVKKRSFDGGITWSDRQNVPESFATSLEVPTIYRVPGGKRGHRLLLFSGLYPIRMAVSEDEGETFSELKPIFEHGGIVAMSDMITLNDGRLLAVFHDDGRFFSGGDARLTEVWMTGEGARARTRVTYRDSFDNGKTWTERQRNWVFAPDMPGDDWRLIYTVKGASAHTELKFIVYQTISEDGGLTWSTPAPIAAHERAHLCEPCLVRSPDGGKILMLMRENSRRFNSFRCVSCDEGRTWSEPVENPGALTGDRFQAAYLADGRLFISFRDTTLESPTKGDWVAWVGAFDDALNGREGQYRVRIMQNHKDADCAYPAIETLDDGALLLTTYGHWTAGEEAYIMCARVKPDELDALYIEQSAQKRQFNH